MASIGEVIGKLESAKGELEEAKTSADAAVGQTEKMVTQAEAMELADTATELQALNTQIEAAGAQITALESGVDELIAAAKVFRRPPNGTSEAQSTAASNSSTAEPASSGAGPVNSTDAQVGPESPETPSDPGRADSSTTWVVPGSVPDDADVGQTPRPVRESDASPEVYEAEGEVTRAPSWKSRVLAKKSAAMTVVIVGGISTAVSSVTPLPGPVQAAVTSFITVASAWATHKEHSKDEEE